MIKVAGLSKLIVSLTATNHGAGKRFKLSQLLSNGSHIENLIELRSNGNWKGQWLFSESLTYTMLTRGNSAHSEPFRKWW